MILLVGDRLVGPKGALVIDLRLVESSPPRYFALLVGSRLIVVPLRDTYGRERRTTNSNCRQRPTTHPSAKSLPNLEWHCLADPIHRPHQSLVVD
jgi:hypothetical protein